MNTQILNFALRQDRENVSAPLGFKLIVHPFINGIVPLEQEC